MGKKKQKRDFGVVYSTDPNFEFGSLEDEHLEELLPNQQRLRVSLDRKNRKGKAVTLVRGFQGAQSDLDILGKYLKSKCGVGGSAKDGEIMIQGDHVQRVVKLLISEGYTDTKRSGG